MLARSLMCGCVEEERSQCISVRSSCDLGGGGAFDLHAISVRDRVTVDLVVGSARAEATSARSQNEIRRACCGGPRPRLIPPAQDYLCTVLLAGSRTREQQLQTNMHLACILFRFYFKRVK